MKTPEFMDKQISGHSRSWSDDSSDYDDEDGRFSSQFAFRSSLPRSGSDNRESAGAGSSSSSLSEALIALVDQRMKEQTALVLHAVAAISVRLAQLERRTRSMEGSIDDLKESLGNYHGITYGKLKELEILLREVQSCTVDVRDKQDITLAQIQLTKLQLSKAKTEPAPLKRPATTAETQEATHQPYVSPHRPHQNPLVSTVTATPSISHQEFYYQPPPPQMPPPQPFSGPSFLQQTSQPPQMPEPHQHFFPSVPQSTNLSFSVPPNDFSYMPPQNVSPSAANPPFQHFESSYPAFHYQPTNEHYSVSPPSQPQLPYLQKESNYDNLYHQGLPNRNPAVETSQLPAARLPPHALPTASIIDSESSSGENRNSNRTQSDDVVEKVVAMGFRRDVVRSTVRRMTEKGQTVDPNTILDVLANGG